MPKESLQLHGTFLQRKNNKPHSQLPFFRILTPQKTPNALTHLSLSIPSSLVRHCSISIIKITTSTSKHQHRLRPSLLSYLSHYALACLQHRRMDRHRRATSIGLECANATPRQRRSSTLERTVRVCTGTSSLNDPHTLVHLSSECTPS
jgi:hypothetical protein